MNSVYMVKESLFEEAYNSLIENDIVSLMDLKLNFDMYTYSIWRENGSPLYSIKVSALVFDGNGLQYTKEEAFQEGIAFEDIINYLKGIYENEK